ncbi:MAG: tetratricopeptide repeat protein [bacterium]
MAREALEFLLNRNSIQEFHPVAIPLETREKLLEVALRAPHTNGLQAYSMILVEDKKQRENLGEVFFSQKLLLQAPLVVVFCIDVFRWKYIYQHFDQDFNLDHPLIFLMGAKDSFFAAQNMRLAAECLGLGAAYISDFFSHSLDVQEILKLPSYVFPTAILCIGYPLSFFPQGPNYREVMHQDYYQYPGERHIQEFSQFSPLNLQQLSKLVSHRTKIFGQAMRKTGFFNFESGNGPESTNLAASKLSLEQCFAIIRKANQLTRSNHKHLFCKLNLLLSLAQFYLIRRQPQRAVTYFLEAIKMKPERAELYCCLGAVHQYMGNIQEAQHYFQKALNLDKQQGYFYLWLGELQLSLSKADDAEESFAAAVKLDPELTQAWLAKARLFTDKGMLDKALYCYLQAEKLEPQNAVLLNNMAVILLKLQRFSEAIEYCDRALRTRPRDSVILANKGLILSKMQAYHQAAECYTKALNTQPDNVDMLNNKGYCLMKLKKYQEALAIYELALEFKPNDYELLDNKASCLALLGRHQEAVACYDDILANIPSDAAVLNNKALCLVELGKYKQALSCYQQALEQEPDNPTYLGNLAGCYLQMKRYEEALTYYEEALCIDPEHTGFLSGKGICLDYLGRLDEALTCYNLALKLA